MAHRHANPNPMPFDGPAHCDADTNERARSRTRSSIRANIQRHPGAHEGTKFQRGYECSNEYRSTTNQQIHGYTADLPSWNMSAPLCLRASSLSPLPRGLSNEILRQWRVVRQAIPWVSKRGVNLVDARAHLGIAQDINISRVMKPWVSFNSCWHRQDRHGRTSTVFRNT
jgi:hypothetical protein